MTMRFIANTGIAASDTTLRFLFAFLDFMRTASPGGPGWSIPRSSNGSVGGAGDNIASFSDLSQFSAGVSVSWFVLRSPDGAREIMWFRTSAADNVWTINLSAEAAYVGGDEGNIPTAVNELGLSGANALSTNLTCVLHMAADDAAPYGFHIYGHTAGNFSSGRFGYANIPITGAIQPGDIDPWVFAYGISSINPFVREVMSLDNNNGLVARVVGAVPGFTTPTRSTPGLTMDSSGFAQPMVPNDCAADDNGNDLSFPIVFGIPSSVTPNQRFKGVSDFVQWNGRPRAAGETFASRTRVSWGDVNFPWDGSVPAIT